MPPWLRVETALQESGAAQETGVAGGGLVPLSGDSVADQGGSCKGGGGKWLDSGYSEGRADVIH